SADATSLVPIFITSDSTALTMLSRVSSLIGRFVNATRIFWRSLSWLNGSRRPSFLTTVSVTDSTRSYVVKRRWQDTHSRRRRIESPPLSSRLSMTRESRVRQNGQRTTILHHFRARRIGRGATDRAGT